MFDLPKEAVGAVVAAVIAALISLLGLIISKENKVSEFRQAWIDSLRAEIAAVITHAYAIHGAYEDVDDPDETAKWQDIRADFVSLNEAWAKIKLRLNPKEKPSIALLEVLEEHKALFATARADGGADGAAMPDVDKLISVGTRLLEATQVVLKQEWRRVKFGEFVYRAATISTGLLVVMGLYLLLKPILCHWVF